MLFHLKNLMIDRNGQADSITPTEKVAAFKIANIHNGHPSYFLSVWENEDKDEDKVGGVTIS